MQTTKDDAQFWQKYKIDEFLSIQNLLIFFKYAAGEYLISLL